MNPSAACVRSALLYTCLGLAATPTLGAAVEAVGGWGVYSYADVVYRNPDNALDYAVSYSGSSALEVGVRSRHDLVVYELGEAESYVELAAEGALTPVLKARAEFGYFNVADPGRHPSTASATAIGREVFRYVGTAPKDITLFMHVDADLFGTDAQVDAALTANAGLSDFELIGDLGSVEATLFDSGVASEGFSFAVAPGDYFSIRAMLSASVTGQSNDADAYNSLSVSFADPTGLVAVSTVPVPGTIYLFGIAAAGLSRLRRSRPAQDRIR